MKKLFLPFILLAISGAFFWQTFLHGLLPIPADTIVGLYNPYRDLYAKDYPRGIPFKNFLITDPVRQEYPWRQLAVSLEKQFQLPLWNPYSFSGYPLLANFQSASLYPFNFLFFILPFEKAWTFLIMLAPILGSIFMYFYLRNLKLHQAAALLGGISFAFSGFFIAWLEWGTIAQTFMWVPLLLLAIDKLLEKWTSKWALVLFFADLVALLAGHIQVLFYSLIITHVYVFVKIFFKVQSLKTKNNFIASYLRIYLPFFCIGSLFVIVAAVQWIPTLQFILLSARGVDQNPFTSLGWFIPVSHLIQFIAPDFFGNPTTLNYWGVWNYAEFVGYVGIVPLVFALFASVFRHDKKTWFFSGFFVLSLLFALPTFLAQIPFALHIPFLSTAQPTRLLAITDFSLAALAGLGLDFFLKSRHKGIYGILGALGFVILSIWMFVIKFHGGVSLENVFVAKQNLYVPTLLFILSACAIGTYTLKLNKSFRIGIVVFFILLTVVDLFRFGWKFDPFTSKTYVFPQTRAINFLQRHIGNYRFMTTDSQILPPNFSVMYKLQSIEGYDPLYLQNYAEFIAALTRNKPDIKPPYGYNRIITPHIYQSKLIDLLGVKYVLSLSDIEDPKLVKVFQEGITHVYENTHVLPRAFFVQNTISVNSQQEAIQQLFISTFNPATTAVIQGQIGNDTNTHPANVVVSSYSENKVSLQTKTQKEAFLVLTDVYYPTWHAYVDGKQTTIYKTDYLFRGVVVPAGSHRVEFVDQLF